MIWLLSAVSDDENHSVVAWPSSVAGTIGFCLRSLNLGLDHWPSSSFLSRLALPFTPLFIEELSSGWTNIVDISFTFFFLYHSLGLGLLR